MSDLISRQAAIKAIEDLQDCYNGFSDTYDKACLIGVIEEVPTIEAEPFKAFAHWVASEVCNEGFENMWSLGAFAEVACRKLYALGIVQKFRDEWVYVDKDELDGGEK